LEGSNHDALENAPTKNGGAEQRRVARRRTPQGWRDNHIRSVAQAGGKATAY